ncbi:MAG: hypothetical protein KBT36_01560 [Kurthia sp.]|nr:hypothetical protein [Candidatus Kurthia equi]
MTNSLKITLADNAYPIVERFQNDMKVGEKKITKDALFEQLIDLTPIDKILYVLMNSRIDDLEFYLGSITDKDLAGAEFITAVLSGLPFTIKNTSKLDETMDLLFSLANNDSLSPENFNKLILNWGGKIKEFPAFTVEHLDIMETIVKRAFQHADNWKMKNRLADFYKAQLRDLGDTEIKEWVINHLDQVPLHELKEYVQQLEDSSRETVVYNMGKLPKNAVFVTSSNRGFTYFYDIPMAQYSVKFAAERFNDVGHPRLLFGITVSNKGIVSQVKLGALKTGEAINENTVIYKYPYSNVFASGVVCWRDYHDLDIDTIPMMFLSAPNNSHLGENTLELFKRFENSPFDEELLGNGVWQLSQWV